MLKLTLYYLNNLLVCYTAVCSWKKRRHLALFASASFFHSWHKSCLRDGLIHIVSYSCFCDRCLVIVLWQAAKTYSSLAMIVASTGVAACMWLLTYSVGPDSGLDHSQALPHVVWLIGWMLGLSTDSQSINTLLSGLNCDHTRNSEKKYMYIQKQLHGR